MMGNVIGHGMKIMLLACLIGLVLCIAWLANYVFFGGFAQYQACMNDGVGRRV